MDDTSKDTIRVPDYELADHIYVLKTPALESRHEASKQALMEAIRKENLAPLYLYLHTEGLPGVLPWDSTEYDRLSAANKAEIEELEKKISQAEEEEEELAQVENWVKLGDYYAKIGDREKAISTLRKASELTASSGVKIDVCFTIVRIGFFFDDKPFIGRELEAIKLLIDRGGDWERRNKYKTYNGLYLMSTRQFNEAADLLIDSLATFTTTEITSYETVVAYAIICGAIALDRVNLKRKIIDSAEVLSLLPSTEFLEPLTILTNSLHTCDYATCFQALARVEEEFLRQNRYLAPHTSYYVREMRRKAYAQLLESYKTLSTKSMADAFGVSVQFLDR
jgi:26S proteasome regulatory subunit N7